MSGKTESHTLKDLKPRLPVATKPGKVQLDEREKLLEEINWKEIRDEVYEEGYTD